MRRLFVLAGSARQARHVAEDQGWLTSQWAYLTPENARDLLQCFTETPVVVKYGTWYTHEGYEALNQRLISMGMISITLTWPR